MQGENEAAWSIFDTEPRSLTVTGTFDPTSITGGATPRKEMIIGQIHGPLGNPPLYLACEHHVATPRIRLFKYNGSTSPGVDNMLPGITATTEITYRIEYAPGADPAGGTGRVRVYGALGGPENLPATPQFTFAPADFFDQTSGWYFKAGAYNKTTVASASAGAATATISRLELVQPDGTTPPTTTGALDASLSLPLAALAGALTTTGQLGAVLATPPVTVAGSVRMSGVLAAELPVPTAALDAEQTAPAALAATVGLPGAELAGEVTALVELAAAAPLPLAELDGAVTAAGTLAAELAVPLAHLGGTGEAVGALGATLHLPAAALAGEVVASGELVVVLDLLAAALAGTSHVPGALDAEGLVPLAELTGAVAAPGELVAVAQLPVATLTAGGAVPGQLVAVLPLPRASLLVRPPVLVVTEIVGLQAAWPVKRGGLTARSLTRVIGLTAGVPTRELDGA